MSLPSALTAIAEGHAGLQSIIGAGDNMRFYPVKAPDNVREAFVTYQIIDGPRESAFGADTGDVAARVQIDCYSPRFAGANGALTLSGHVRTAFQRTSGTYGGTQISHISILDEDHGWEKDSRFYRVRFDFRIWFKE